MVYHPVDKQKDLLLYHHQMITLMRMLDIHQKISTRTSQPARNISRDENIDRFKTGHPTMSAFHRLKPFIQMN